jgi:hypothetical protein
MRRINLIHTLLICLLAGFANAQVTQNVIVEHFTNTNCSVCGSRNPGFYTNLNQNLSIRHIAYHPSSPYASCFFSKQNKIENDDRTKYYGVFGGTPRLVIQGVAISSGANYSSNTIFDPFIAKTTPIQITLKLNAKGADSLSVEITLTTKAAHSLGAMKLFAAVVEKEVTYAAPNGETKHHDVFRKSFFETNGMAISLSSISGDSVIYKSTVLKKSDWSTGQLYAVAILNKESDKSIIQSEQSNLLSIPSGLSKIAISQFDVYPNPVNSKVNILLNSNLTHEFKLLDITGKVVLAEPTFAGGEIDLTNLPNGIYFIQISENDSWFSKKLIKQ